MSAPEWTEPLAWEWAKGDRALWPNGVEGAVAAVDFDDMELMDEAGGWHSMYDVDRLPS